VAGELEDASRLSLLASFDIGTSRSTQAAPQRVLMPLTHVVAWSNACLAEHPVDEVRRVALLNALDALDREATHAR
jgi:hypothetical protein